ncbi:CDP-glycerol glycerophosphotransferase family protein [Verrucosispora sp. WMMA2044]|uniref:CDP-glycerol glycerophosphotransferase family protein n=1 Tax=Verrucosispora sp. WMMA2044 TaxID=3016419 RepID=UPI0032B294BC
MGFGLRRKAEAKKKQLQRKVRLRSRLRMGYYRFQLRRPMDEGLALFSAYWGKGYGCNPRAVYEKMTELAPRVRGCGRSSPARRAPFLLVSRR